MTLKKQTYYDYLKNDYHHYIFVPKETTDSNCIKYFCCLTQNHSGAHISVDTHQLRRKSTVYKFKI